MLWEHWKIGLCLKFFSNCIPTYLSMLVMHTKRLLFQNAVMSFEEDQIQQCRECLKETERKYSHLSSHPTTPCTPTPSTPADSSWYSSVKNFIIGTSDKQVCEFILTLVCFSICQPMLAKFLCFRFFRNLCLKSGMFSFA